MFTFNGCTTALITPMNANQQVDYEGLRRLIDFQIQEGVSGLLAMGTTGESPTLNWEEHSKVIEKTHEYAGNRCFTIAGTGSNSTQESIEGTQHAKDAGINAVLLVDPYYNGPSSMEIRREYIEPIAKQFPDVQIIPYIIPGRTGTQLFPQDLAILHQQYSNVRCVKEATGDIDNMKITRQFCGDDFEILSGDDDKTYAMMINPEIRATGAISVVSNVAPRAVADMIQYVLDGDEKAAAVIHQALQPLFSIVTVKTQEQTPYGPVTCRARNPLAFKTLMNILGMPSGPCRQPLGKMTPAGIEIVLANARKVYETNPQVLEPIADYFSVNLKECLYNKEYLMGLTYA
ncbi:MAG: 4-hydroxy-tetrahydrodipicolinate synthase [Nitrososphaerota archaeon]|jgi:4-hydroxy-tetrahydrodipicolinate synthase|nr:4-hydroxy-tetrahydrodipicolinate synthase [Nitrososphaerota archaeon]